MLSFPYHIIDEVLGGADVAFQSRRIALIRDPCPTHLSEAPDAHVPLLAVRDEDSGRTVGFVCFNQAIPKSRWGGRE
jgi:hypothetical protein